jgi:AcrR family transcriptional regulator/ferredoxin
VGLSPTAIYLYFRNIDELHEHLRLEGHALLAGLPRGRGPSLPVVERIRAMGRAYHRFGLEHPREYALMFNVRAEETPRHEALVREMETLMQLRRVVEEGIARGELRADIDPMVTTNALWAQIHGVTALTVSRLLAETTHGDEAAVVEAVLDATPPGSSGGSHVHLAARPHRLAVSVPGAGEEPPDARRRRPPVDRVALAVPRPGGMPVPNRGVQAPIALDEFKRRCLEWCDDVGVVSIDDPALAHEREGDPLRLPAHALARVHDRRGEQGVVAVALPPEREQRALPLRGTPVGDGTAHRPLPEHARRRGPGHDDRLAAGGGAALGGQDLAAQPQAGRAGRGLGVIGVSRNFLHKRFGAYCLIDTVLTNVEWPAYDAPTDWNPCVQCNLCVASCPTEAIRADGHFDFFACYNHTYRDSIPGFLDLVWDLKERSPREFRKRWTDNEIAGALAGAGVQGGVPLLQLRRDVPGGDRARLPRRPRRPPPLPRRDAEAADAHAAVEDEQFVIDTPLARERHGIPPGQWRTPPDRRSRSAEGVRLVSLRRIRTQNVDAMMRWMPQYFRPSEAKGSRSRCSTG